MVLHGKEWELMRKNLQMKNCHFFKEEKQKWNGTIYLNNIF